MASSSSGLQSLLDAEKDAHRIVQKARNYRTQKLKEARTEALFEIEAYRKSKEEEFDSLYREDRQENERQKAESLDSSRKLIQEIKNVITENKDKIVENIIDAVAHVDTDAHRNAILAICRKEAR